MSFLIGFVCGVAVILGILYFGTKKMGFVFTHKSLVNVPLSQMKLDEIFKETKK
jgi:hypothetical protein